MNACVELVGGSGGLQEEEQQQDSQEEVRRCCRRLWRATPRFSFSYNRCDSTSHWYRSRLPLLSTASYQLEMLRWTFLVQPMDGMEEVSAAVRRLSVFHDDGEVPLFMLFREAPGKGAAHRVLLQLDYNFIVLVEPEDAVVRRQLCKFTVAAGQQDVIPAETSADHLPHACQSIRNVHTSSDRSKLDCWEPKCLITAMI